MNGRCHFEFDNICMALIEKKCEGCKFRKTTSEYTLAQAKAEQILRDKKLKGAVVGKGKDAIMSTVPMTGEDF